MGWEMRVSTVRCGMWRTYGPKIKNQIGERVDTKQTVGRRKIVTIVPFNHLSISHAVKEQQDSVLLY